MGSPVPGCAPSLIFPCLHFSVLDPVSPLLKTYAVTPGLYFSKQYHCVSVINISFYTGWLLVTAIHIKLRSHLTKITKVKQISHRHLSIKQIAVTAKPIKAAGWPSSGSASLASLTSKALKTQLKAYNLLLAIALLYYRTTQIRTARGFLCGGLNTGYQNQSLEYTDGKEIT